MPADNRRGKQKSLAGVCRGESLMWSHRFLPPQPRAGGVMQQTQRSRVSKRREKRVKKPPGPQAPRHPGT